MHRKMQVPTQRNAHLKSPNKSPIASKDRHSSPTNRKSSAVRKLFKRMTKTGSSNNNNNTQPKKSEKEVESVHDIDADTSSNNFVRGLTGDSSMGLMLDDDETSREMLFSPKYQDVSEHLEEGNVYCANGLMSPPSSPKKGKQVMNAEVGACVKHMRKCVWNSAYDEIDGFLFMKYAPQLPLTYFDNRQAVLPAKSAGAPPFTLVLDLDETLVHCAIENAQECDQIFPVVFNGEHYKVYMNKRPFFQEFLETVSQLFEVVVFTASQQCYADKLLNIVDPGRKLVHHRLFRNHCINVEGNFVKDLRVLGRDLSKTIIIDNSPPAFTYQVDNGIPIVSWYEGGADRELEIVLPLLKKLLTLNDVRPAIKKYFQLKKLLKNLRV